MIKNRSNRQQKLIIEHIEKVTQATKEYKTNPDAEMELLDSLSRYPGYSIRNIILAEAQNKGSFGLASSKDFQIMGFSVQKGQEAIFITVPHEDKLREDKIQRHRNQQGKQAMLENRTHRESAVKHFRCIPVYDITQTNCPPDIFWKLYPEMPVNFDFDGSDEDYECLEKALHEYASEKGLSNHLKLRLNPTKAKFFAGENETILDSQLHLKERIVLLVQEVARAEIGSYQQAVLASEPIEPMTFKEDQKEMAAYVVSKSLGMDKEAYTQSYLMIWQPKAIKDDLYIQMLEEVKEISLSLIATLVEKFNDLKKKH